MTAPATSTISSTAPPGIANRAIEGSLNRKRTDKRGRAHPRRSAAHRTANATPATATSASTTIPNTSSVLRRGAEGCPPEAAASAGAADAAGVSAPEGSFTPPARASLPTAASVASNNPAAPDPIEIPANTRYADVGEWPGQLNPNPFGITTNSRCL